MLIRLTTVLLLSVLSLLACSSAEVGRSVGTLDDEATSSTAAISTVDPTTTETPTTEAQSSTTLADTVEADVSDEAVIGGLLDRTGIEFSAEERECLLASDVVDADGIRNGDPDAGDLVLLASLRCAPETMAELSGAEVPVEGVDPVAVVCALTEAIRFIGTLDVEAGLEAIRMPGYTDEVRAAVLTTAPEVCGLDEEQVEAVLDS